MNPGEQFQLTGITQTLLPPPTVFVAGYNLGLLSVGMNTVPGNVRTIIEGTNTVEGTQATPVTSVSVTTTITDPDGVPGSGDEAATDPEVTVNYPDQTWTTGPAGAIRFREDTVPLGVNSAAILVNATIGGFLQVQFRCSPGTVDPLTGVITLTDPAPSFAQVGDNNPPTPTPERISRWLRAPVSTSTAPGRPIRTSMIR